MKIPGLVLLTLLGLPSGALHAATPHELPDAVLEDSRRSAIIGEEEWRRVVTALRAGSKADRARVLVQFVRRDVAAAAPILLWYVRNPDADLSSLAGLLLQDAVVLEPRLVEPLRELLVDPHAHERSRRDAVRALSCLRPPPPAVLKALRDVGAGGGPLTWMCVRALGRIGPAGVPHLLYLARQVPSDLHLPHNLHSPLASALLSVDPETLREELRAAKGDYRTLLVGVFVRSEPVAAAAAVPELLTCLDDDSAWTRQLAVEALWTSGVASREVRAPMLKTLQEDSDYEVRMAALGVLARCENDDGEVSRALTVAAQTDEETGVRLAAAQCYGELEGDNAFLLRAIAAEPARPVEEQNDGSVWLALAYVDRLLDEDLEEESAATLVGPLRSLRAVLASAGREEVANGVAAVLERLQR